uniref:LAGLIDADG endonuclease n=1 Tax=Pappia fissilis TaxID=1040649 RepID=UPI002A83307D|nr:LAGLIDADG endonuclease [Pappia fissilis]WOX61302.1 LAGLIDADG endonuclease [Pappia fissilis]
MYFNPLAKKRARHCVLLQMAIAKPPKHLSLQLSMWVLAFPYGRALIKIREYCYTELYSAASAFFRGPGVMNIIQRLILLLWLINGKMITPKIHALWNLIDWLNLKKDLNIAPPYYGWREKTIKYYFNRFWWLAIWFYLKVLVIFQLKLLIKECKF